MSEDDLALDFSKIKKFFKSEKREKHEREQEKKGSEELTIEPETLKRFFKKHGTLFLLLIPILLSIYLRSMPAYLPITDQWAENAVQNSVKANIEQQILQQYPNLPAENRAALVNQQFQQVIAQQKDQYEAQVKAVSQQFKSHLQDDDGQTYLLAIDPYTYYRQTKNLLENGHVGDTLKNGRPWDTHMIAPLGRQASSQLHHYAIAIVYKIMHFFNSKVSLMKGAFYVPLIIATLSVIPAFFIARRFGGNIAGLFASVMVAVHPNFLTRTIAGFSDTDAYNVLFPLLVVWLFLEAFYAKDIKKRIMLSSFSGILLGIYSFAWAGWWYIFDFMLGAIGIFILYQLYINRNKLKRILKEPEIKSALIVIACFIIFSGIFVSIFLGFSNFIKAPLQPLWFTTIKDPAKPTLWPNVYTTVAEMNPASISSIISGIGGKFLFFIAILGILFTLIKRQEGKIDIKYAALLTLWFIGTIYAATKGVRFILVLVPAFGVAFGIACGTIYQYVSKWISKGLSVDKMIIKPVMVVMLCLLLIAPLKSAKVTAINEVPSFDDAWYNTLTKIKDSSEKNAIINSWWDFGHWFKAMADRPVTFDGASQNNPQAHWIGHVLLTSSEEEAIGILRMLDCGANTAFDELNEEIDDTVKTVDILYEIIVLDKRQAKKVLTKYVSKEKADSILEKTHCQPPEDFFITSEDMVGKAGVWAHFGGWDFIRSEIWVKVKKMPFEQAVQFMVDKYNFTKEGAEKIYYEASTLQGGRDANTWISPWPSYYSGLTNCKKTSNVTIQCDIGVQRQLIPIKVDLRTADASIEAQQGIFHPKSIVWTDTEGFQERVYKNNTLPYSMALIMEGENDYKALLMAPELAKSMFTRLFYYKGYGLKHFDPFDYQRSINGWKIYTWKVNWEGREIPLGMEEEQEELEEVVEEVIEEEETISNISGNETNQS